MKLLPSLKQKKRYIVFEIISKVNTSTTTAITPTNLTAADVQKAVEQALLQFLGEFGVAKVSPMFVKYTLNKFILKVNHTHVEEAKAALILIKSIKNTSILIRSITTSGTLKKVSSYV